MAKILIGGTVADIRGSVGGLVYSRNRAGAYVRNKTTPIDAASDKQSAARNNFAAVAALFQTLTSDEADAWTQYAALLPRLNSFGQEYIPSGKQMFLVSNLNRSLVGQAMTKIPGFGDTTVPSLTGLESGPEALVAADVLTRLQLSGLVSSVAGAFLIVQNTPPMQAVRQSYRNRLRDTFHEAFSAAPDMLQASEDYFNGGNPIPASVGQIINIRSRLIDPVSGLSSAWYYTKAVIKPE